MRRRALIGAIGGAALLAGLAARAAAQGSRVKGGPVMIGVLSPFTRDLTERWHRAFEQGLREHGWIDGANARLEYRHADGRTDRLPALVVELIQLKPDVLVAAVTTDAVAAATATKEIPIVMASAGDPLGTGVIASLNRPGGNVTGLTQIATDLTAKRLQLLKEVAPGFTRAAVFWYLQTAISQLAWQEIQDPARELGVELHSLEVRSSDALDAAFAAAVEAKADALLNFPGALFDATRQIVDFAAKHRLPSMFHLPDFVHAGGLMAYGADRGDLFRRAATYVDQILKGAHPRDLPVEQPTKFGLVLNLRTAKALGLMIPQSVLARADEVIE